MAALVVVVFADSVRADLPVHCPHHKNVGSWEFSMVRRRRAADAVGPVM